MKKFRVGLIAIALTAVFSTANAVSLSNGTVYSANEGDASISAVTLSTGAVQAGDIPVLPHNVQISPDGKFILAVGPAAGGHGQDHGGEAKDPHGSSNRSHADAESLGLVLLNASKPDELIASLPAGSHPAHVVTSQDGAFAYVTNADTARGAVV